MNIGDVFNLIFLGPVINLLVIILQGLNSLHIPGALGLSIVILTVLIRLVVWPLMSSQLKSAKKMSDLKPHLDQLKKKHGDDKQAFAQAQMSLYKEHGVNPAGGCLPSLIQIPIIIALYQTILALFNPNGVERINHFLYQSSWHLTQAPDPNFLGVNLAVKPMQYLGKIGSEPMVAIPLLLIPVITGLLQFLQSRMMMPKPVKEYKSDSTKEKKEKETTEEAMMAMQGQMMFLMPVMIGYFAFSFPVGLAIYWNTFTIMGIWQQYLISGWGGVADLVARVRR